MDRLDGKVALVTGGGSGIGRATALAFARAGATVIIAGRRVEPGEEVVRAIEEIGGDGRFVKTDVSRAGDVETLVARTLDVYGRLDYASNNAGIEGASASIVDQTEEDFDEIIGVNVKGVWLCMKYEIPAMLRTGGGVIVNVSSLNAVKSVPTGPFYSASKAAVESLTKATALGYAKDNIRVNAVGAGAFRTPMLDRVSGDNVEVVSARYAAAIPLGRIGQPEEIARAVVWLCSDAASYVTGHVLAVDGGLLAT